MHRDDDPPLDITSLLELDDDALAFVLAACDSASLCNLAAACQTLHAASAWEEPWHAALRREMGVPRHETSNYSDARALFRRIKTYAPRELLVTGVLTDGGIDGVGQLAPSPPSVALSPSAAAAAGVVAAPMPYGAASMRTYICEKNQSMKMTSRHEVTTAVVMTSGTLRGCSRRLRPAHSCAMTIVPRFGACVHAATATLLRRRDESAPPRPDTVPAVELQLCER